MILAKALGNANGRADKQTNAEQKVHVIELKISRQCTNDYIIIFWDSIAYCDKILTETVDVELIIVAINRGSIVGT